MNNSISADSSFYICLIDDINHQNCLNKFLNSYSFFLGKRILKEITPESRERLVEYLNHIDVDYYELVKPYFGRNPDHIDDGEYEAIGIAHFLVQKDNLKYLILDEKTARNFVETHFDYLLPNMVGTIGFIEKCCCIDSIINKKNALEILETIKTSIESDVRPCSMDKKSLDKILNPCIERINDGCLNG